MKIDPTDKLQAVTKPGAVKPNEKTGESDFASVFEQKVARSESPSQAPLPSVSPLMPPSLQTMSEPMSMEKTAAGLIDSLERYQQMLADPTATLKDLSPVVENMKKQSDDAQKMLNSTAEDDPVKGVLQESVLVITKEVERFNLGVYVED